MLSGFGVVTKPSQYHMSRISNYVAYAPQVHEARRACLFPEFFEAFNQAYQERLVRLKIIPYRVTEVRAIGGRRF